MGAISRTFSGEAFLISWCEPLDVGHVCGHTVVCEIHEFHDADLNVLIRSAIYARRPDDFTSFMYSFRRSH